MMTDVEDFIAHVLDPAERYDPAKAHEYYLRNRKLKGRRHAAAPVTKGRHSSVRVKSLHKPPVKVAAKAPVKRLSAAQERKKAEAQVAALQKKLDQLRKVLAELVKQAKGRSGVATPTKTPAGKSTAAAAKTHEPTAKEKLTAQQKAKKAKAAKEAYDKLHPDAKVKELQTKVAEITKKIHDMKAQVAAAHQKSQAKPKAPVPNQRK